MSSPYQQGGNPYQQGQQPTDPYANQPTDPYGQPLQHQGTDAYAQPHASNPYGQAAMSDATYASTPTSGSYATSETATGMHESYRTPSHEAPAQEAYSASHHGTPAHESYAASNAAGTQESYAAASHGSATAATPPVSGASKAMTADDLSYQRYQNEDRSLGEIAADTLDSATRLVKQEVELAKSEAKQTVSRAGKGAGLLAGAGVAGLMALFALTLALWWGLAILLGSRQEPHLGLSGIIVTVLWAAIAGALAMAGKGALEKAKGLPQTTETLSKIPNAATGNEEKNR